MPPKSFLPKKLQSWPKIRQAVACKSFLFTEQSLLHAEKLALRCQLCLLSLFQLFIF